MISDATMAQHKLETIRKLLTANYTSHQKCVGIAIVLNADASGTCNALATPDLMQCASAKDRETIYAATSTLAEGGFVEKLVSSGGVNGYRLLPGPTADAARFHDRVLTLLREIMRWQLPPIGQHLALAILASLEVGDSSTKLSTRDLARITGWSRETISEHLPEIAAFLDVSLGSGRAKTVFRFPPSIIAAAEDRARCALAEDRRRKSMEHRCKRIEQRYLGNLHYLFAEHTAATEGEA